MRVLSLLLLAPLATTLHAQQTRPSHSPDLTGSVSGHITCEDTHRPARIAEVRLVPVTNPSEDSGESDDDDDSPGASGSSVQTDLTGAYTFDNVTPGNYYLRVDYDGYLTPLLSLTRSQIDKPTPEIKQLIEHELQLITVAPNSTTQADATLTRGASISGNVRYDDGSPAIGINMDIKRVDKDGAPLPFDSDNSNSQSTGSKGEYEFISLPAGHFVIEATASIDGMQSRKVLSENKSTHFQMRKELASVTIFSGNKLHRQDAQSIETTEAQEVTGIDLTLPLDQLHSVSGTVTLADGQPVGQGKVRLLIPDADEDDDDSEVTSVTFTEGQPFHLLYVPDGTYTLSVERLQDTPNLRMVKNDNGEMQPRPDRTQNICHYDNVEQPLVVKGETDSILVTVPTKNKKCSTRDQDTAAKTVITIQ